MDAAEFWNKIKIKLNEIGKTQEWLFNEAGLPVQSMRNRVYKERMPSLEDSMKLFSVLKMRAEDFYDMTEARLLKPNVRTIPVTSQVLSAGKGQYVPDTEEITEYIAVPKALGGISDEHLAACHVKGDSMYPTLYDGDLIICDNLGYDGSEGIYAINYCGKGYVKRLQKTATGVQIISDNKVYPVIDVKNESEDLSVIGKVHCFQRTVI